MATEVQVTQGYSWTEEMGIVIACLVEDEKTHLINWAKEVSPAAFLIIGAPLKCFVGPFRGDIQQEAHNRGNGPG